MINDEFAAAPASALSGENSAPTKGATAGVWSSAATVRVDGGELASAGLAEARRAQSSRRNARERPSREASLERRGSDRSPALAAL